MSSNKMAAIFVSIIKAWSGSVLLWQWFWYCNIVRVCTSLLQMGKLWDMKLGCIMKFVKFVKQNIQTYDEN